MNESYLVSSQQSLMRSPSAVDLHLGNKFLKPESSRGCVYVPPIQVRQNDILHALDISLHLEVYFSSPGRHLRKCGVPLVVSLVQELVKNLERSLCGKACSSV